MDYKQIGDVLFYHKYMSLQLFRQDRVAVEVSHAGIKDFVSAYDLSVFNPILLGWSFHWCYDGFVFVQ